MKLKVEPPEAGETTEEIRKRPINLDLEDGEIKEEASSVLLQTPTAVDALVNLDRDLAADSLSQPSSGPFSPTESPLDPLPSVDRAMSPEELDHAKSIVLDLLGWGVQPEYLVDCGVSSHAILRIFTDLHLRLPTNLILAPDPSSSLP